MSNRDDSIYDDLKKASIEELIRAAELGYGAYSEVSLGFIEGLQLAQKIAGRDGWKQIAPQWLHESKEASRE